MDFSLFLPVIARAAAAWSNVRGRQPYVRWVVGLFLKLALKISFRNVNYTILGDGFPQETKQTNLNCRSSTGGTCLGWSAYG